MKNEFGTPIVATAKVALGFFDGVYLTIMATSSTESKEQ
jgi:hypothetical protein